MNTTPKDTTDTDSAPRRAPRQRAGKATAPSLTKGYAKAAGEFAERAQTWLRHRPGRTMQLPEDLPAIIALGIPCQTCGAMIYRQGDAGHTIRWQPKARSEDPSRHWSAGITASCAAAG